MANKKQTAVEWLEKQLPLIQQEGLRDIIEEAKAMEKEQMWEYIKKNYCIGDKSSEYHRLEFEQYYTETYGE